MATDRIWDIPGIGNVERQDRSLRFRLQGKRGAKDPVEFMATLTTRDVSKTLRDIERAAKTAGVAKKRLLGFMKGVARLLPTIFGDLREEESPVPVDQDDHTSPEMQVEAEREAERILGGNDPLTEVDKYLGHLISGEEKNRKILFLKAVGTKTEDRRVKWIVVDQGESGAGKTVITRILTRTCRCKVVGRLTAHALDYMELTGYDVLVLQEIGFLDKEDSGLSTIKFVSYDDNGYTVEAPVRDPETGEMTTKQYRIPPINILTTSTRVSFDPQFERRAEFLNPDESEEQTKRVHDFKATAEQQNIEVKLGTRKWIDADFAIAVVKAVLAGIKDLEVEIPFPHVLNRILRSSPIRTRGDIDKIYANVRLYTLLNQRHHRPIEGPTGHKIIFVSPDEAIKLVELCRESLETMIGGIDRRTKKLVQAMANLGFKAKQRIGMDERMKLASQLKRSPQTIYQFLERLYSNRLVKKGKEGEGKTAPVFYELIKNPLDMISSPLLSAEEVQELRAEMLAVGIAFLRIQRLPPVTFSEVMKGWGRSTEEARKRQKMESEQLCASSSSQNQVRRTMRSLFDNTGSKPEHSTLLKSIQGGAHSPLEPVVGVSGPPAAQPQSTPKETESSPQKEGEPMCPPWFTTTEWSLLSSEDKLRAWEIGPIEGGEPR